MVVDWCQTDIADLADLGTRADRQIGPGGGVKGAQIWAARGARAYGGLGRCGTYVIRFGRPAMLTNSIPGTARQPRSDTPAEPPADTGTSARARSQRSPCSNPEKTSRARIGIPRGVGGLFTRLHTPGYGPRFGPEWSNQALESVGKPAWVQMWVRKGLYPRRRCGSDRENCHI